MSTVPAGGRPLEPVTVPLTVTGAVEGGLVGVTVMATAPVAGPTVRGKVAAGVGPVNAGTSGV